MRLVTDTIVAAATPPGRGGIGVVRLSGPAALAIGGVVTGTRLAPRHATFCRFRDTDGTTLDEGIAIAFPAPASFTGEDVLELPLINQLLAAGYPCLVTNMRWSWAALSLQWQKD